eukprot:GEZU01010260.1.p1 GENE.GEZU01010260.1~~GEZU01010260.1.p1  ORF type:complete len:115 (+),score=18.31 GEZU01010260.1:300-644(+)
MGRKKIEIKRIKDDRNRSVTFLKRKNGLMKKAMELSILCDCQIGLIIFNAQGKLFKYASDGNLDGLIARAEAHNDNFEDKKNQDVCTPPCYTTIPLVPAIVYLANTLLRCRMLA